MPSRDVPWPACTDARISHGGGRHGVVVREHAVCGVERQAIFHGRRVRVFPAVPHWQRSTCHGGNDD